MDSIIIKYKRKQRPDATKIQRNGKASYEQCMSSNCVIWKKWMNENINHILTHEKIENINRSMTNNKTKTIMKSSNKQSTDWVTLPVNHTKNLQY